MTDSSSTFMKQNAFSLQAVQKTIAVLLHYKSWMLLHLFATFRYGYLREGVKSWWLWSNLLEPHDDDREPIESLIGERLSMSEIDGILQFFMC